METKSLKALAFKVLKGNKQGNSKETLSFPDGNLMGGSVPQSFPSETQGNTACLINPADVEDPLKLLKMPLSQFKEGGYLIRVRCKHLGGEDVFIASTEREAQIGRAEGLTVYLADELLSLVKGKPDPETMRTIHNAKKVLGGTLIEANEKRESKKFNGKEVTDGK